MFSDLLYRFRAVLRRNSVEAELEDKLRAHLEHQIAKYVQSGLTGEEAARRARLDFGGLDQVKEESVSSKSNDPWEFGTRWERVDLSFREVMFFERLFPSCDDPPRNAYSGDC